MGIKEKFQVSGFVKIEKVFDAYDIDLMRKACDDLSHYASKFKSDTFRDATYFNLLKSCDPFDKGIDGHASLSGVLRRITYPYLLEKRIDKLRVNPLLLDVISQLIGPQIKQIVNQINFNPPKIGQGWSWHQDSVFRRPGIESLYDHFVQSLVAIDSCDSSNGGFWVIPESHRNGNVIITKNDDLESSAKCVSLNAGDAIFFNPYLIHGSRPNISSKKRRVFINGFSSAQFSKHGKWVWLNGPLDRDDDDSCMEYEDIWRKTRKAETKEVAT